MLAKNPINRNKMYSKAKIDFMLFIENNINGQIEWE